MSEHQPASDPDQPRPTEPQSTQAGRRRGRVLVPGVILAVILGIFVVLLLVTRCGSSADDVSQGSPPGTADVHAVIDAGSPLHL
jgi:hypothetical protein